MQPEQGMNWHCVRSQPKHEHIAARSLGQEAGIEVYLPRIKFRRATREGPVWFTEALFPNYLFARFDLRKVMRQVQHTRGVAGIVHFGEHYPVVPEDVIANLRATVSDDDVHVVKDVFEPGTPVTISGGSFDAFKAVVSRVMPSRERVAVLLDFLGRQTEVEVPSKSLLPQEEARARFG
jgi:transcriptional antiterminator RfaH